MKSFWNLTPFPWYADFILWLVILAYVIYAVIQTFRLANNAYGFAYKRLTLIGGIKETFFEDEKYFTLYDVVRLVFIIPPIVAGTFILLLLEGAWNLFPFIRKILGFKLFRIEKENKS